MIAVIAALPREIAGLVKGLRQEPAGQEKGVHLYRRPGAVVVAAGMGTERVTLAVRAALAVADASELISAGLAGGCDPTLKAGTVLEADAVVDALSGERYPGLGGTCTLVTTHSIAGVREKRRLHETYGAAVVDMEAAAVARLAGMNGLRFCAVKAVSDAHDFELAALSRFASPRGHFRTGAFALHTALRPGTWRKAMQLGSGSQLALRGLTARLEEMLG